MEVQANKVQIGAPKGHPYRLLGVARLHRESELAVQDARCRVDVGVGVDPRGDADHDLLDLSSFTRQTVKEVQLIEAVNNHPADAVFQGVPKLLGRLVVAVEVDVVRRIAHRRRDGKLAARHHVQPKPLLHHDAGQGRVDVGLAGVDHGGVGVSASELLDELPATAPKGLLVEDVEGCAEAPIVGQVHHVAAAYHQVPPGVDLGCVREHLLDRC